MMKSLKKMIIGALVPMAMAIMLPMTAMAAYSTTVEIPVKVETTGEDVPDQKYTVTIKADEKTPDAPMPEKISYDVVKNGEITFGPIEFTKPEDYKYTITETVETLEKNVTLGEVTSYDITVRVLNDGKGGLETIYWAGEAKEGMPKPSAIGFVAKYTKPVPDPPSGGGGGGGGNSTRRPAGDALIGDDEIPLAVLGAFEEDPIPLAVLPMTGDVTNMALWMLMFVTCLTGFVATLVVRRKVA